MLIYEILITCTNMINDDEFQNYKYLQIDYSIIYYYFKHWKRENNEILIYLCDQFINRRLFKYIEYDPETESEKLEKLKQLFIQANIDPTYYLTIDSSKDLPYDVYRSGRVPIYLQMPSGEKKELSTHSVIVESITGKTRKDHKLYYPREKIKKIKDTALQEQICELLNFRP